MRLLDESRIFDGMQTGQSATFTCFRREFSVEKAERFVSMVEDGILRDAGVGKTLGTYITDAPESWRGAGVVEMEVTVQNPLVLLGDDKSLEARLWDREWSSRVFQEYDSVISVPKAKKGGAGISARQGLLFRPAQQILSAHVVGAEKPGPVTTEGLLRQLIGQIIKGV